jgi:hypothetical protein
MADNLPSEVQFHYIKSNYHRTIHVDGAHGAVAPQGGVTITLFSERFPIPRTITQKISPTGELLPDVSAIDSRTGIVRELEVSINLTNDSAKRIAEFMLQRVAEAEQLEQARDKK